MISEALFEAISRNIDGNHENKQSYHEEGGRLIIGGALLCVWLVLDRFCELFDDPKVLTNHKKKRFGNPKTQTKK